MHFNLPMVVYEGVNLAVTLLAGWRLAGPDLPRGLRASLALISLGGVMNVIGLIWFDYQEVWVSDIVTSVGVAALLGWHLRAGARRTEVPR
ncbi:hypothetical protein [Burkholderia ubonensis]|uniref:hypothetical protein n=1 Tax=Burkholderia ubonensis TaxID=101571 RepID=UPI000751AD28|nr:hypothetical protein [Burkholderia ubonensis]KWN65865.1 hypothetical protein WM23_07710 [Burkholderia ubonensis]